MSDEKDINTEIKKKLKDTTPGNEQAFFQYVFEHRHDIKEKRFPEIEAKFDEAWTDFYSQKIKDRVSEVLKSPYLLEDERKLFFNDVFQNRGLLEKDPKTGVDLYLNVKQTFGADWENFYAEKINAGIRGILSEIKNPSAIPQETKEELFKDMFQNRPIIEKVLFEKFEKKFGEEWKDYSKNALEASEKNLYREFRAGNTAEYISTLEALSAPPAKQSLIQGPLPKNEETRLLESMVKSLLTDPSSVELKIQNNNQLMVTYQGNTRSLNEILQKADFNQLSFSQSELSNYVKFLESGKTELHPQTRDTVENMMTGEKPEVTVTDINKLKKTFSERDPNGHLANLSLGEKLAINIYTTGAFTQINQLLRGQIGQLSVNDTQPSSARLKELLLVSAIGAHGLNRIADEVSVSTFRVDENLPTDLIEARKEAAKNNGITRELGFLSSAQIKPAVNFAMKSEQSTATVFTGLVGKNVAALSNVPEEKEWLIPPTQFQWHNVAEVDGKHYFSASPVRSLDAPDVSTTAQKEAIMAERKRIIDDLIRLRDHPQGKGLELQQKIMANKDILPEHLRLSLAAIMGNLKVEQPVKLSTESEKILNQRLKGGRGESNEISTEKINESLEKISNLNKIYETNHVYQNQIDLLNEIDKFMNMADWKILNNASKSTAELKLQTNIVPDSRIMLDQMRTLALYGQALSGNNEYGRERIAEIEQVISHASSRFSQLNPRQSSPEELALNFPVLNQRLKSGYGIFSKSTSVRTADINQSLNEISRLVSDYQSYADKNPAPLLSEITKLMSMMDMKIASNMQKSERQLQDRPNIVMNTLVMQAQMEALASMGKTLSGDKQFGDEKIADANQAISKAQTDIPGRPTQPLPSKPAEAQFKQDEAMVRAYLEGNGENTDVLKRIFYLVQQGGLTARPGDEIKNKTNEIPLAAALCHGERILIEGGDNSDKLFDWIRGGHDIPNRSAATHSLKINGPHDIQELRLGGFEAKKGKIPSRKDLKQYERDNRKNRHFGLNMGLSLAEDDKGNKTIPIAAIEDGKNGHLYIYYKKPTKAKPATLFKPARPAKPGAFLIGLESAEARKQNNLTGAGHTAGGSANELSATGGLKWTDKAFADYRPQNGFYVDLSNPDKLNNIINSKPEAYQNIQNDLGKPVGLQAIPAPAKNPDIEEFEKLMAENKALHDKVDHLNTEVTELKTQHPTPTVKTEEQIQHEKEARDLIQKSNNLITRLDIALHANDNDLVKATAKELIDIHHQIRAFETTDSTHHELKQADANITHSLSWHPKTEQKPTPTFSGAPSRPQLENPPLAQREIINTLQPVLAKSDQFSMEAIPHSASVLVKKDAENFMNISNKEIQAHSVTNNADDYKIMIQAAAKMFDKPLLIYVPESEKGELNKAITSLINDKNSGLKITDVECTTNQQEYKEKQKTREQTPAAVQNQALAQAAKPEVPRDKHPH